MSERRRLPKYVVEYEVPKGSGKWFVYFRRRGQKDVRMHGTPYSAEWMATYHALLAEQSLPATKKKNQIVPVIEQTFASGTWRQLISSRGSTRVRRGCGGSSH